MGFTHCIACAWIVQGCRDCRNSSQDAAAALMLGQQRSLITSSRSRSRDQHGSGLQQKAQSRRSNALMCDHLGLWRCTWPA